MTSMSGSDLGVPGCKNRGVGNIDLTEATIANFKKKIAWTIVTLCDTLTKAKAKGGHIHAKSNVVHLSGGAKEMKK